MRSAYNLVRDWIQLDRRVTADPEQGLSASLMAGCHSGAFGAAVAVGPIGGAVLDTGHLVVPGEALP